MSLHQTRLEHLLSSLNSKKKNWYFLNWSRYSEDVKISNNVIKTAAISYTAVPRLFKMLKMLLYACSFCSFILGCSNYDGKASLAGAEMLGLVKSCIGTKFTSQFGDLVAVSYFSIYSSGVNVLVSIRRLKYCHLSNSQLDVFIVNFIS